MIRVRNKWSHVCNLTYSGKMIQSMFPYQLAIWTFSCLWMHTATNYICCYYCVFRVQAGQASHDHVFFLIKEKLICDFHERNKSYNFNWTFNSLFTKGHSKLVYDSSMRLTFCHPLLRPAKLMDPNFWSILFALCYIL